MTVCLEEAETYRLLYEQQQDNTANQYNKENALSSIQQSTPSFNFKTRFV